MSLLRCTDPGKLLLVLMTSLLMTACASAPGGDSATTSSRNDVDARVARPAGATDAAEAPVIAPEVMTLFEQATAVMAAGDFVDAELRFKEFVLLYPDYPGAHVNLAIIHRAGGNDEAARGAVDAALALDPDYPPALNQLGMLLRRNGNFIEAEAAYLKAVTVSSDYALAHYNLGVL